MIPHSPSENFIDYGIRITLHRGKDSVVPNGWMSRTNALFIDWNQAIFDIMLDRQSLTRSCYRCGKFNHRYPYLTSENRCGIIKIYGLSKDISDGYLEVKNSN